MSFIPSVGMNVGLYDPMMWIVTKINYIWCDTDISTLEILSTHNLSWLDLNELADV